jgi:hypothetical protein
MCDRHISKLPSFEKKEEAHSFNATARIKIESIF